MVVVRSARPPGVDWLGQCLKTQASKQAKSMVGNDTAGFLLKTCDITDQRKELAGYAGAWLGKLAGEKAGAAACRELMAKLAAEVAEAIALRQAPTIARVVHKRLEN